MGTELVGITGAWGAVVVGLEQAAMRNRITAIEIIKTGQYLLFIDTSFLLIS